MTRSFVFAVLAGVVAPSLAAAQIVTPKTVPVHQSDQFEILPSQRSGMGGVWIALDDSLLDPFANPAKAARIRTKSVFLMPYSHSISENRGGGQTLPFGGAFLAGKWSGMVTAAVQSINRVNVGFWAPLADRSSNNRYITGTIGRPLGDGVRIGAAVHAATLNAIDGVDLLYAGSDSIKQDGGQFDARVGLTKEWEGNRVWELVLVHSRSSMTHDVRSWWGTPGILVGTQVPQPTWEHNEDRTHIWGVHTEYVKPVGTEGWRLGWLATANRISHPKIPNFRIMSIPRDPGHTNSFNLGLGVGKSTRPLVVGADFVLEPIFSKTWADAARDTLTAGGGTIKAGGHTVDNTFRFLNSKVRFGLARELTYNEKTTARTELQLGLSLNMVDYTLDQTNHVTRVSREQKEHWNEWTPTVGVRFTSKEIEIQYNARLSCYSGATCNEPRREIWFAGDVAVAQAGGIIVAPSSPITFDAGKATMHRLMVSLPIR